MIAFDKDTCSDFETALSKEWLETNGLGGFSSSTLIGCNTRRYHGLLVAATQPPASRFGRRRPSGRDVTRTRHR